MPWEKVTDEEGKEYYYNSETQETSWNNPEEEWQEFTTDEGTKYYYNSSTGETTWDKPEGFGDAEEPEDTTLLDKELELQPVVNDIDIPKETDDAEAKFTALLQENSVDSTWSFQQVMSKFATNPVYWAVSDPLDRRRLYEEYLVNETKKEMTNKSGLRDKFKTNFVLVLKSYTEKSLLNHTTRWQSVKSRLVKDDNPIFKHSVLSDGEIYQIFKEYQDDLKNDYENKFKQDKQQAYSELEAYLTKINPAIVSESDDWESLYKKLQADNRFKANKHFNMLSKEDILLLCLEKIYPQEIQKLEEDADVLSKQNYRLDRKARDGFKQLLSTIPIEADTTFEELLPLIEDEDAFIELCGRDGSSALDLFLDVVSEKQQLLKVKTDMVETVIQSLAKTDESFSLKNILQSSSFFKEKLSKVEDDRLSKLDFSDDQGEVDLVYELLKKSLEQQARQQKNSLRQSLTSKLSAFSYWLMSHYEQYPIIEISDTPNPDKIILTKDPGTETFLIKYDSIKHYEIFKSAFSEVPEFQPVAELQKQLDRSEQELHQDLETILNEFVKKLNSAESRKAPKRPAEQDDTERKRGRVGKAKPKILNY